MRVILAIVMAAMLTAAPANPPITARHVASYQAWAIWVVPRYHGLVNSEVAQWVGLQFSDLCQAGIASTMLPGGQVQTSLIAQDWPHPFAAVVGPRQGDMIIAFVGKVGTVNEARVTDLTTGQTLAVPCASEGGAGWPLAEWASEYNPGQPHLLPVGGTRWIEQGWSDRDRWHSRVFN